ncbi:MAG: hypothetical protein LUG93_11185 [Lachnospiraceae bacterium]|nr:hypothetical protein [Lachnospiraceae bacterium]
MGMKDVAVDRMLEPELGREEVRPDICVCCGRPVPEGRMICWNCEHEYDQNETDK